MEKHTLSNTAKQFLNFNDDTFDRPISFTNTPVHTAEYQSVKQLKQIPDVVWDACRYLGLTDCPEFDAFLTTKKSSNTVTTDNDIFDEAAFNADVKALEREYSEETAWLKTHMPKSPAEASSWNQRLQERDNLRRKLPDPKDPKYHSKEKVVVTFNGTECKSIISKFKAACNAIEAKHTEAAKAAYFDKHHITMSEDTFSFIKLMRRLNQIDLNKIPCEEIHAGSHSTDARDDLFKALSFDSVESYNDSLSAYNPLINSAEMNTEKLAICNPDVVMAAAALLSYCVEFQAMKDIESKMANL